MHAIIRRHLPVITSRIDFSVCPQPPLPVITQRTSFLDYNGLHDVSSDMGDDVGDDEGDDEGDGLGDDVASMGDGLDDGLDDGLGDTVMNEIASASNINAGIGDYFIPGTSVIPKPPGEPGRPQSGGFNVEATLAWPKSTFTKVVVSQSPVMSYKSAHTKQNYTHLQASKVLDTSKCYSKQSKVKIDSVCVSVSVLYLSP